MAAPKKTILVVAALAILTAGLASGALYKYLKAQESRVEKAIDDAVATERIVVAEKEIPIGKQVSANQVKLVEWPKANLPAGAIKSPDAVVERVALQTFFPEDPITEAKLMPKGGTPGLMNYKIPEGHRAMTVGVDQVSGVAGFITPGSMVDVVLTAKQKNKKEHLSKIVLQNVPVLATGQIIEQKDGEPVLVPTVTLDVMPDEAEKLALSSSEGRLQLLLRRSGDEGLEKTSGATITKVIREAGKGKSNPARTLKIAKRAVKRVHKVSNVKHASVKPKPTVQNVAVDVWRSKNLTVESFKVKKEAPIQVTKKED